MLFHNTFISSIMSRDRFLQIFYNLHLADSSLEPKWDSKNYSKIYKVKNFTEIVRRDFQKNYNFGRYGAIDESMIKFKGRPSFKQYLPPKFDVYVIQSLVTSSTIKSIPEKKKPMNKKFL